jgi:hypothetical protein
LLQNDVLEIQEVFSELEIRVFLETWTWKFPDISYLTDLRRTRSVKKIPKTVLKTRLKIKQSKYTLIYIEYLLIFSGSHSITAFLVFLEYSLKIISRT